MRLRHPTNKYYLMHKDYANHDKEDLRVIAKKFAEVFGIPYEHVRIKKGAALFQTDDSDFHGNGTSTYRVELWLIIKWAKLYDSIEWYDSPHLTENEHEQTT